MREIKFRAWNTKEKKMSDDFGLTDFDGSYFIPEGWYLEDGVMEVMQFTGLKDKNGNEIYEGDIIKFIIEAHDQEVEEEDQYTGRPYYEKYHQKHEEHISKVEWNGDFGRFDGIPSSLSKENKWFHWEVIGNIWENPELLKNV